MKIPPIGLTADVHMDEHTAFATYKDGFNSRLLDAERVVLYMAESVAKCGGKTLIVVGDWFHSRRKISVNVLHVSARCLHACKSEYGINVIHLIGNHDLSLEGHSDSVCGQPFYKVITKPGVHEIDGWRIGFIPWTDSAADVKKAMRHTDVDMFLGHFGVAGSRVGPSDFEIPGHVSVSDVKSDVPVFLGHYHKPQKLEGTSVEYIGSPLQLSWGERNEDKRFLMAYKKTSGVSSMSYALEQFPRFVRLTEEQLAGKNDIRSYDFVEVQVSEKRIKRARADIANTCPQAVITTKHVQEKKVPRVNIAGKGLKSQVEAYMEYEAPPRGISREEARKVAMELLGGGE